MRNQNFMMIQLPEKVHMIIQTLMDAGYEAYAVGGCVRDSILGRIPDDWDITTSAKPQEVKSLFRRTIDTGIQHGTVTIMMGKEGFEVTTYRIDGEYEDHRHPKEVLFTSNLIEDLKRRDFTINAMAYNEVEGLVDAFEGLKDLENGIIRAVGDPRERFTEDALRIMRAVRFAAQLGYEIEEQTKQAAITLSIHLKDISVERIQVELVKLLTSKHPEFLKIAYDMDITKVILPEFDQMMLTSQNHPHHCYNVGEHTLKALEQVKITDFEDKKKLKHVRLAVLFHDIGKPETKKVDEKGIDHFYGHPEVSEKIAKKILQRLHFDNDTIKVVCALVKYHDYKPVLTPQGVRRAIYRIGEGIFPLLFPVKKADIYAQSDYMREQKLKREEEIAAIYEEIVSQNQCLSIKDLAITGKDLMELGIKPSKELGDLLNKLLDLVLEDPSRNTKEELILLVKENRNE